MSTYCIIPHRGDVFSVKINNNEDVGVLKDELMGRSLHLKDHAARTLELYKINASRETLRSVTKPRR